MEGKAIIVGTMTVEGEELTGVFVECSKEELKENAGSIVYEKVAVIPAEDIKRISKAGEHDL